MAIALTTEVGPTCGPDVLPLAALEMFEAADAGREPAAYADFDTTVSVIEGVVYMRIEDDDRILTPGDTYTVSAGTSYSRWNAGEEPARWVEVYCAG